MICFSNNFSTNALDDIYCALPARAARDNARIFPVVNDSSSNYAIVMATNKANATSKNWAVQYYYYPDQTDIPATTGTYVCGTGIEDITHSVSIYPNPARDILNIHSDEPIESLALYDAQGRCVLSKSNLSAQSTTIDVSSLDKGIYMLKLLTAGGAGVQKVAVK
ncbi:MAG: T9SS type A sorting domain-containing protein [Porphyromonadaceae bacterium]|nr:T9SS type A sorting domain-containing protein [Porphyromonadaceae bacterium]